MPEGLKNMSNKELSLDNLRDLRDHYHAIDAATQEIKSILSRCASPHDHEAAKAYWLGYLETALDGVHHSTFRNFLERKGVDVDDDSWEEEFEKAEEEEEESP